MSLLHLDLPAEPAAIARARDACDELMARVSVERLGDLRLLVSEVVTNAVRHTDAGGDARVVLVVEECEGCMRIEVHDDGPGFVKPEVPVPRSGGTSGWGLFLVQRLARRWGVHAAPDAFIWFELTTS